MNTLPFATLAVDPDALTQESDLIIEVTRPYIRMLSKFTSKGVASNAARVPHATTFVDYPDAHKMIATSKLRELTTKNVLEWVQRELWNVIQQNCRCVIITPATPRSLVLILICI